MATKASDAPSLPPWSGFTVGKSIDPVEPGTEFVYEFSPPDAGTFWFHPHCNSIEQIGRGLTGVLVVEGPDDPPLARLRAGGLVPELGQGCRPSSAEASSAEPLVVAALRPGRHPI